ncbi:MAG: hypothetical protein JWP87_383, partial [Labilithrix sp.]|nr:hypothetical protein [Labilithrix sp.]
TRAEEVSFDARQRTLELVGNVRVDSPPFHLTSQRIRLTRTRYGIEIVGRGSLAFCPCLGTPLKVDFDEAIVAPPGDLILKNPTLRFYDVPILPLPYFWLRSDEKLGVLPPDLAYRGQDGVFAGGGVHVPWKSHGAKNALDLRGGAYVLRGFVADARLRTASSTTKVRYDRLPGGSGATNDDGLLVDARGATSSGELGLAWDADVLRGDRGVASTTELDAAARRWDRATAEGALRGGPFVVSTAMRAVTRRGGNLTDVEAAGPIVSARASGAAGTAITYDVTLEGGSLRTSDGTTGAASRDALSFARGEIGARAVGTLDALEASVAVRGAGDVAANGTRNGTDRAASARARLGAPLARRYGSNEHDPWVHVIDPYVEGAILHARGDDLLGMTAARGASGVDGTAPLAAAGFTSTIGRWSSREAFEIGGAGGTAFGSRRVASQVRPLARGRAAASLSWLGASADVATVLGGDTKGDDGFAAVARARLGRADGLRVLANVAAREGLDPILARALVDAPLEPASGFLVAEGTTGGAGVVVPWARAFTTSLGADADLTRRELVAARAGIELRDRCGCLTLRVLGAHRLGRDGVDVWLALDFAADR